MVELMPSFQLPSSMIAKLRSVSQRMSGCSQTEEVNEVILTTLFAGAGIHYRFPPPFMHSYHKVLQRTYRRPLSQ